ncbi:cobalamin biosynthesis protein [Roseococcus pinisoli]|uniref:Cobalamin biosynthesis protein n=1 Tax=Roseococcus pinisoli TaxID=2835040 RepID=A0ABS5QJ37_9PROT|nr:cobalamin biosynthesis protein [Roseococcus pinisoli]MBS7813706.1 cobalamin biosynthesis protein [Roseococcus pinisoli]
MNLIAGIGCRRGASAEEVIAALDAALAETGRAREAVARLATIPLKAGEPGIAEAAAQLGIEVTIVTDAGDVEVLTESRCSRATAGLGSVAEAAALAAAGVGARLLAPRSSTGRATCALAETAA